MQRPFFDGADESEIKELLWLSGQQTNGQSVLFDGCTGEAFHEDVTVGVMYHAQASPSCGRENPCSKHWALLARYAATRWAAKLSLVVSVSERWKCGRWKAYGAAYALQEFLTVKSDDVQGRVRMYESIVRGENRIDPGIPESFNVLMKELQALCLNIELIDDPNRWSQAGQYGRRRGGIGS